MGVYRLGLTIYGVKVGIETNRKFLLKEIESEIPLTFPVEIFESEYEKSTRRFSIKVVGKEKYKIEIDGEKPYIVDDKKRYLPVFFSYMRVKIAEYAESKVFIHAGVVGWKGKAIIIPAESYKGKSTLVAELVKFGCSYYSDEYAVLDEEGYVHPYPKMISIRETDGDFTQTDFCAKQFGTIGAEPIPAGLVLITEYEKDALWDPLQISTGQGILEILSQTIPIRYKPEFTLFVLNKSLSRAIIAKSKRGEALHFAKILITYFEETSKLNFT